MKGIRKRLALITSVLMVILLVSSTACNEKKISVEDYPEPEAIEKEEERERQEFTAETDEDGIMTDEEFMQLITNPDPFEKTGQFSYNPATIPENLAKEFRDRPEIIRNAKYIMYAVYNFDSEFEIPVEDVLKEEEFFLAYNLASTASPLVNAAMLDSEDYRHFTVDYLPQFSLHMEEDGSLTAETVENNDDGYARNVFDGFVDYVSNTINKNVSADDSEMKKAEAVYRALAEDFEANMDLYGSSLTISEDFGEGDVEIFARKTLVEGVWERKLDQYEFAQMYQFILTQLNIECMCVLGSGTYHKQNIEELDKYMEDLWQNTWNVVVSDGKAYNCDLFMEIAILDNNRKTHPGSEPDMNFFGMSDASRNKTYTVNRASLTTYTSYYGSGGVDGEGGEPVPECVEDYIF